MGEQLHDLKNVPIFAVGTWNHDTYSAADLDAMVAAYSQVGWKPPLKLGHDPSQTLAKNDGMPALGWVGNLRRVGQQLVADFTQMPRKVWEAISRKAYNRVSAEVYWDYSDGAVRLPRVLKAVALLGADIPAVTSLGTLEGLYDQEGRPVKVYDFGVDSLSAMAAPPMPPPMPMPKKSKAEVGYAEAAKGLARCSACKFYCGSPSLTESWIAPCSLVEGEVAGSFTCSLQEPREAFKSASKRAAVKTHAIEPGTPDPLNPPDKDATAVLAVKPDGAEFCVFKGDQKVQCFPTQEEADALLAEMGGGTEDDPEEPTLGPDGQPLPGKAPVAGVSLQDKLALAGDAVKAVAGVLDALDKGLAGTDVGKKPSEGFPPKKDGEESSDDPAQKKGNGEVQKAGPDGKPAEEGKKKFPFGGAKPFAIERRGRTFALLSRTTGKTLGEHETYEAAVAHQLAMEASKAQARRTDLTADQLEPLCKSCADRMRANGIKAYKFFMGPVKVYGVERGVPLGKVRYFAMGPNADALCEKFGADEGFFTKCEAHMAGQDGIDDPKGFCAELHKTCTGKYPSEKKAEAPAEKAMARYAVEQRPSGLWDLVRANGSHVATYATEQEAKDARGRLEVRRPFEYAGTFDESEHPRGGKGSPEGGKFVEKGSASSGGAEKVKFEATHTLASRLYLPKKARWVEPGTQVMMVKRGVGWDLDNQPRKHEVMTESGDIGFTRNLLGPKKK